MGIVRGSVLSLVIVVASACGGDDDDDDDGGGDGATIDAAVGTQADAAQQADAAATPDAAPGAPDASGTDPDAGLADAGLFDAGAGPDAATDGMIIDSVVVDGSFTQVHQGSEFELVVRGSGLAGVTEVAFDDGLILNPDSMTVTDTEVRIEQMWVYHGVPTGPRALTLSSAEGSVTEPDAFEVTPWIIGAGAPLGGRATDESPMSACDPEFEFASGGDLVELSAGEHVCDYILVGQAAEIRGQGVGVTILGTSMVQVFGFDPVTTAIRDLTVIGPGSEPGHVGLGQGSTVMRDVALENSGVEVSGEGGLIVMERVAIDGGGAADCVFTWTYRSLELSDVEISRCRYGVAIPYGQVQLTDVTIAESEIGLYLGVPSPSPSPFNGLSASLTRVDFLDDATGIQQARGLVGLTDVEIRGSSVSPGRAETGLLMTSGSTNVTGLTVAGVSGHGIDLHSYSDGAIDYHASLGITASVIEGGEVGIDVVGSGGGAALGLHDSTVRDQTEASVRIDGYEDSFFTVEDCQLSVESGHALDDVRVEVWAAGEVVRASGTTLNGNAYDGQLLRGPLDIGSDLRIVSDDAYVQF